MYLSNRDLAKAISNKTLIVDPPPAPKDIGPTSIDLHLDNITEAKIWDMDAYAADCATSGRDTELHLGTFDYRKFSSKWLKTPPGDPAAIVFVRGHEIVIKPNGFVLWQTKEQIGTPPDNAKFICFVDGKSTRARTGLLIHLTAPTIHAQWAGNVTLEIANLGPFNFVLKEDDVIAQITVAKISSVPKGNHYVTSSVTIGQQNVTGAQFAPKIGSAPSPISTKKKTRRR